MSDYAISVHSLGVVSSREYVLPTWNNYQYRSITITGLVPREYAIHTLSPRDKPPLPSTFVQFGNHPCHDLTIFRFIVSHVPIIFFSCWLDILHEMLKSCQYLFAPFFGI